jgi:DNA-binding NtrC family response regulator
MPQILLVGSELPLLEGLSQSFAALGFVPIVAQTLHEAREVAAQHAPLVAVVSRRLAAESSADTLSIPVSAGGALVLYSTGRVDPVTLSPTMQRSVLADLTLPLERNRLMALVQHLEDRARATGRGGAAEDEFRPGH